MTDTYEKAISITLVMLRNESDLNRDLICSTVDRVLEIFRSNQETDPVDRDRLVREIESRCESWQGTARVLEKKGDHRTWLPQKRSQISWRFWRRYRRYLEEEKQFFEQSIVTLDDLTDSVLEQLEDPQREGSWDRRGMVVGQVQSGKTSHYTGLICKAADAGYKLIIVLAGMHKSLRSQTQIRLDEGFLGFDTQLNRAFNQENLRIGVGKLPCEEFITVHSLTSSSDSGDFNRRVASQVGVLPGGNDPVLLVVKKNKSVLRNLINWAISVRGQEDPLTGKKIVHGIPLLVIDDEADNASVNTIPIPRDENGIPDEDYDVSAINGQIRDLLEHFEQSAYIGYTATPFANIFIYPRGTTTAHGDDLFPRDFIVNLPPPPNYIGAAQIFGLSADDDPEVDDQIGLPVIRTITDHDQFLPNNHNKNHHPGDLPESLKQAIMAFILSCAARRARKEQLKNASMLVHVTRFTAVQRKIEKKVSDELTRIRRRLEYSDSSSPDGIFQQMEDLWKSDFVQTTVDVQRQLNDPLITAVAWEEVKPLLYEAAARIQVKIINGTARDVLDYHENPSGLSVIAIGGDKLSRGLTLEGLTVSYYLRASRMYDTLMQMGRWFGFRPGYIDLCRLYTSPELVEWYQYITRASEELRREFDYMAVLNATPADYGLRVRTHPDGLLITAVNKMRSGTVMEVAYGNSLIETVVFHRDPDTRRNNFSAIDQSLRTLGPPSSSQSNHHLWTNVSASAIIELMDSYIVHEESRKAIPGPLKEYIQKRVTLGELTKWTVALINNSMEKPGITLGGLDIGLTNRTDSTPDNQTKYSLKKGHLIDPRHEFLDLTSEQIKKALEDMCSDPERKSRRDEIPKYPSGPYIRKIRSPQQGLLLIYPLRYPPKTADPDAEEQVETVVPVMGLAFSISHSPRDVMVQYRVNNIYWEQEFGG